ncbi:hypothetical protein A9Q77_05495, partial [Marinomonas sp. 42_23_T18]
GYLLTRSEDADYWFAFNLSLNQSQECLHWLETACFAPQNTKKTVEKAPLDKPKDSEKKEIKEASTVESDEPVYNPMLDLINHDFG